MTCIFARHRARELLSGKRGPRAKKTRGPLSFQKGEEEIAWPNHAAIFVHEKPPMWLILRVHYPHRWRAYPGRCRDRPHNEPAGLPDTSCRHRRYCTAYGVRLVVALPVTLWGRSQPRSTIRRTGSPEAASVPVRSSAFAACPPQPCGACKCASWELEELAYAAMHSSGTNRHFQDGLACRRAYPTVHERRTIARV